MVGLLLVKGWNVDVAVTRCQMQIRKVSVFHNRLERMRLQLL